jgi:CheY-like chemotaxis protein
MRKLLVIDDDAAVRRLIKMELGEAYEMIDSGDPEQGLALALENKPDAILVDLRMPKYSGFELVHTYANFSQTQNVPVVIVSGEAGSQTKEQCKRLGAAAYFEKPIDFEALRTCLAELMRKRNRYTPRSEVRVTLSVLLKVRGQDRRGSSIEEAVTTEKVTVSGFLWQSKVEFPAQSTLDVYFARPNSVPVGKAEIVHAEKKEGLWHYQCRFLEKPREWVLD